MRTFLKAFLIFLLSSFNFVWAADPPMRLYDEGSLQGVVFEFNFTGAGVACSRSGVRGTCNISGGGGGGSGTLTTVKENGSQVGDADMQTLDFLGADFDITESPDTEANIVIAAALTRDAEWDTEGEVQTVWGGVNILLETEIDAGSELLALLDDETGTGVPVFNNSPLFVDDFDLATAGVRMTGADGVLTILGLGNGNDENLTFDFDNGTANNVDIASGTSVSQINWTGILSFPTLTLSGTGTINGLDAIDTTTEDTLEGAIDIVGDVDGTGLGGVDLDEAAVEAELEGVIDLADLQEKNLDSLTGIGTAGSTAGFMLIADGTDYEGVAMSGDATINSAGVVTIANNSVDGTDIALGSDAAGDIMYYNGTDWVRLAIGSAGQVLEVNAAGDAPEWDTDDSGGGGNTAWDDVADPDADTVIAMAGFETDITSTLDSNGKAILTITNTDADTDADTDFISLAHNDGADANIFYFRAVGDLDGTPQTDYRFSQTAALIRPDLTITGDLMISGDDLFMGTNTSGMLLIADGTNFNPTAMSGDVTIDSAGATTIGADKVALTSDTTGNYVATVADGTGIDGTASGEGTTYTPTLDLTEISSTTWGAGSFTTMTFDAGTCDPRITVGNKILTLGCVNGTNNEDLTFDFDTTANTINASSSTGMNKIDWGSIGADYDSSTVILSTVTGAIDMGGATSTEIVNGTGPTVDAAGETAIDTTDDQLVFFGAAKRVIPYTHEFCHTIESITTSDDNIPLMSFVDASTVTSIYCRTQGGTSATIHIGDGTNDSDDIVCDSDGQADDGSLANATFTANERLEMDTVAVSGSVTWTNICVRYSTDAQ